jgi:hypothetical protein
MPEKREILRLLKADKPLPEKYRFLLFDARVPRVTGGDPLNPCGLDL